MNKTHLVMALLLISGKSDFQPIISCSITKPKECFTLPHKVFFVIYFNSGKGRLDLQGHGWLVRREVSTGGGKVTCDKNVKANYVSSIKVQFCHRKINMACCYLFQHQRNGGECSVCSRERRKVARRGSPGGQRLHRWFGRSSFFSLNSYGFQFE